MAHDWPEELLAQTGRILSAERPSQGTNFDVAFLTTERGRFVLKRGETPTLIAELERETQVLAALAPNPLLAQPVAQTVKGGVGFFLFTYLDGETIAELRNEMDESGRHRLIEEFARTLRQIHGWTPDQPRPTDWLSSAIARAADNVDQGRVPGLMTHLGPWQGIEAQRAVQELATWRSGLANDIVWGHGDYCLPNVLMQGEAVTGVIDWSAGGYADRRFDLATAQWTIRYNLGAPEYWETFRNAYGDAGLWKDLHYFEALYVLL